MMVTLHIEDQWTFSGHPSEDLILDNMDRLCELIAKDLQALDPDHHTYTVRREK